MVRTADTRPEVVVLTRREFLTQTAAAAGGAVLVSGVLAGQGSERAEAGESGSRRVLLPKEPNQNPAFMARASGDGGLLLWSQGPDDEFAGYRLNASGRQLWRLCDGSRDAGAIAAEYSRRTGRPALQGLAFVEKLLGLGIIVSGATIVATPEFPTPPPGGCYHRRIEPDDPVSG